MVSAAMANAGEKPARPRAIADSSRRRGTKLDEQPGLFTIGNVLDCPVEELKIGMDVEVVFEKLTDDVTLPQWSRVE